MPAINPLKKQETSIVKQIAALERKKEALRKKHRAPVIKKIVQQMHDYGITPEEITESFASGSRRGRAQSSSRATTKPKSSVKPKYRNPETGDTWSGRGKAPRWLTHEESKGATREQFLIAQ